MTHLSDNAIKIMQTILAAPSDLYTAGASWYQDAHDFAVCIAERYGYSIEQASGVIAALSPQQSWDFNKRAAEASLKAHAAGEVVTQAITGQTQANISKALRIMDGQAPEVVLTGNMPKSGHKVWSFYNNILNPASSQHVTVDRHAIKIWATEADTWTFITPNRYAAIERDYQAVALALGILPMQAQAIAWCAHRGTAD